VKTASEITYIVSGGALNSTQTKPKWRMWMLKALKRGIIIKHASRLSLIDASLAMVRWQFVMTSSTALLLRCSICT